MSDIKNQAKPPGLPQQLSPTRGQSAAGVRTLSIHARTVVRGTDGAKPISERTFEVFQSRQRIGPFQRKNIPNRLAVHRAFVAPQLEMPVQPGAVADLDHFAGFL